jgi:succinyl-CoA synthetase alpha subunit
MPGFVFKRNCRIVSKSGTLTYEAADQVVKQVRNHYSNWNGGDPIIGTTTKLLNCNE